MLKPPASEVSTFQVALRIQSCTINSKHCTIYWRFHMGERRYLNIVYSSKVCDWSSESCQFSGVTFGSAVTSIKVLWFVFPWWWTGRPTCCDSWGCKESDTAEWLNWTELMISNAELIFLCASWPSICLLWISWYW